MKNKVSKIFSGKIKDTADCVCLQHMYLSGELSVCIPCLPQKNYSGLLYRSLSLKGVNGSLVYADLIVFPSNE